MEILSNMEIFSALCKAKKKFGIYIGPNIEQDWSERNKAKPYMDLSIHRQVFVDGQAFLFFDSKKEMINCWTVITNNSGPTILNRYRGKTTVYAITCSPTGELLNENT